MSPAWQAIRGAGAAPRPAVRWRILAVLFGVSFLAYIFRLNLSVAGQAIKFELGLSDVQVGWILSSFIWGYTLFQFPGGIFGQRLGPRRALAILVLVWTSITVLTGMAPLLAASSTAVVAALLVLRFALGAAQAPLFPVVAGTIEAWFPVSRWAFPNALTSTGLGLGAAVTPPIIAWLMVHLGWRASFYLTAPLGLAAAAWWWFYARDQPRQHPRVLRTELELIEAGRGSDRSNAASRGAWKHLLVNRDILMLALSYLCMNYVFYIFFSWFFIYLVEVRRFTVLESGFLASLPFVAGSLAAALGGEACDRLCKRLGPRWGCRLPGMAGLLVAAGTLFAGAGAGDPYLAIGLLSICFASTQFTEGAYWSGTTFVAGRTTAAATGLLNTGGNLGGVIVTPMIPLLVDRFGWLAALSTGSLFALVGAALWLLIRVDRSLANGRAE